MIAAAGALRYNNNIYIGARKRNVSVATWIWTNGTLSEPLISFIKDGNRRIGKGGSHLYGVDMSLVIIHCHLGITSEERSQAREG